MKQQPVNVFTSNREQQGRAMQRLPFQRRVLSAVLTLATATMVQAQPAFPDAGSTVRDALPSTTFSIPRSDPMLVIPETAAAVSSDTTAVAVTAYRIEGATVFTPAQLQEETSGLIGANTTMADIHELLRRITQRYRAAGYSLARAWLPEQEVVSGVVTVRIVEGVLGDVELSNASRLADEVAQRYARSLGVGSPVEMERTNRGMLLLSDLAGTDSVQGRLIPGRETGSSNLVLDLGAVPLANGRIEVDNHGSLYTGRNRVNALLQLNSPTGRGERISARLIASDEDMLYGHLGLQLPLGSNGLVLGGGYNRVRYELGDNLSALNAQGTVNSGDVSLSYPFFRSLDFNLYGQVQGEYNAIEDEIRASNTITDKNIRKATAALFMDRRDSWGGGGSIQAGLRISSGSLSFDNAAAAAIDAVAARTRGSYVVTRFNAERAQFLREGTTLLLSARGQIANQNLDSIEKFVLGGPYAVRAYPLGEAAGDEGWLASIELRQQLHTGISAALFYDAGRIDISRNPFLDQPNSVSLSGGGGGLIGQYGALEWRLLAAWRGKDAPQTERDKSPRLWASFAWRY